ncbi:MAG: FAD:protein FMN transferase [Polyangiaceae bacterium]
MLGRGDLRRWAALAVVGSLLAGCPEVPRPALPPDPGDRGTEPQLDPEPGGSSRAPRTDAGRPYVGERVQVVEKAMGTRVILAGYTAENLDEDAVRTALGEALGEIRRLERLMTTWRDDSDISRLNAKAGDGPVKMSPETFEVLQKSLWIGDRSEGTFDITFASMGKLWSFDEQVSTTIPDAATLEAARKKIDYRKVVLDAEAQTARLESPDTRVNLGGIAKGYAIDRAAAVLRKAGLKSFFAQAGGDLYVEGRKPDQSPWRVGIRDPRGKDGTYFALIGVENHAFSTAGDYERGFVKEGKRYHHIIDPRTGYPATASRSVTIWAKDALTADAIDDAVFILGVEKGMALVESIEDCGAVIVDAQNQVHISPRLKDLVQVIAKPSEGI